MYQRALIDASMKACMSPRIVTDMPFLYGQVHQERLKLDVVHDSPLMVLMIFVTIVHLGSRMTNRLRGRLWVPQPYPHTGVRNKSVADRSWMEANRPASCF